MDGWMVCGLVGGWGVRGKMDGCMEGWVVCGWVGGGSRGKMDGGVDGWVISR